MSDRFADAALDDLLAREVYCFGEMWIVGHGAGSYSLTHRDDREREDLVRYDDENAAAEIARYDDAGKYRALKTAPNLRHGWKLVITNRRALAVALELFYPARLKAFGAWKNGAFTTTPLRATLARQTGMYRAAAKISDEQANELIGDFCRSDGGCLRTIRWKRNEAGDVASTKLPEEKYDPAFDQTGRGESMIPLLCQEPCNLLVAEARKTAKATATAL